MWSRLYACHKKAYNFLRNYCKFHIAYHKIYFKGLAISFQDNETAWRPVWIFLASAPSHLVSGFIRFKWIGQFVNKPTATSLVYGCNEWLGSSELATFIVRALRKFYSNPAEVVYLTDSAGFVMLIGTEHARRSVERVKSSIQHNVVLFPSLY